MENYFIVDYDNFKLYLKYNGEMHVWDLNDGDIGDFWHSFKDKHKTLRDINFHVDESGELDASLMVYDIDDTGYIITEVWEDIPMLKADGDIKNYLTHLKDELRANP